MSWTKSATCAKPRMRGRAGAAGSCACADRARAATAAARLKGATIFMSAGGIRGRLGGLRLFGQARDRRGGRREAPGLRGHLLDVRRDVGIDVAHGPGQAAIENLPEGREIPVVAGLGTVVAVAHRCVE